MSWTHRGALPAAGTLCLAALIRSARGRLETAYITLSPRGFTWAPHRLQVFSSIELFTHTFFSCRFFPRHPDHYQSLPDPLASSGTPWRYHTPLIHTQYQHQIAPQRSNHKKHPLRRHTHTPHHHLATHLPHAHSSLHKSPACPSRGRLKGSVCATISPRPATHSPTDSPDDPTAGPHRGALPTTQLGRSPCRAK